MSSLYRFESKTMRDSTLKFHPKNFTHDLEAIPSCNHELPRRETNFAIAQLCFHMRFHHSLHLQCRFGSKAMRSTRPCPPDFRDYRTLKCRDRWRSENLFCSAAWLILNLLTTPFCYRCTWLALKRQFDCWRRFLSHRMTIWLSPAAICRSLKIWASKSNVVSRAK